MDLKIAIATDDGVSISPHFGKAPSYVILTVEQGQIVAQETRGKGVCGEHQHAHTTGASDQPDHETDAEDGHAEQLDPIVDCAIVLSGGMCQGMYADLQRANLRPVMTTITDINEAAQRFLAGQLVEQPQLVH